MKRMDFIPSLLPKKAVKCAAVFAAAAFLIFSTPSCSYYSDIPPETGKETGVPFTVLTKDDRQDPSEKYLYEVLEKEKKGLLTERFNKSKTKIYDNTGKAVSDEFFSSAIDLFGSDTVSLVVDEAEKGTYTPESWHDATGNTLHVINDMIKNSYGRRNAVRESSSDDVITLGFGGDFMFSDDSIVTWQYNYRGKGVKGIIDSKLLSTMHGMDIMLLNCEYPISNTGTPMAGKRYVFRSSVKYTDIYEKMGVDIVSLANNHVYDYGEEAFFSTLKALDDYKVYRIGAGKDLDEAREVQYFTVNGRKIAYVSATRAEKTILTPGATNTSPGVFRAYDSTLLNETIREAKSQSDIVILYIHWGAENEDRLESIIRTQGKEYIDSGADFIIGAHAHRLQGIEFYKGKMIAYNLGNFLFNGWTMDTALIETKIDNDGNIEHYFHPLLQASTFLSHAGESDSARIIKHMEKISVNATFDENYRITEKKQ